MLLIDRVKSISALSAHSQVKGLRISVLMSAVKTDQSEGIPGAGMPEQAIKNAHRLRKTVK